LEFKEKWIPLERSAERCSGGRIGDLSRYKERCRELTGRLNPLFNCYSQRYEKTALGASGSNLVGRKIPTSHHE
jgi:hypothetical protein